MTINEIRSITERRNAAAASMDECELAEAHRDDCGDAVVTDPKMTRVDMRDYFGCSYY